MQVYDLISGITSQGTGKFIPVDPRRMQFGNIPIQIYGSCVGTPVFTGEGLDDLAASGVYTGGDARDYVVHIDGTGDADTFKYSRDDGATWEEEEIEITGEPQAIGNEGIIITFTAVTGHTENEYWTIPVTMAFTGTAYLEGAIATERQVRDGTAVWSAISSWTAAKCDAVSAACPFIRGRAANVTKGAVFLKAYL
jgi:hypothetical protein